MNEKAQLMLDFFDRLRHANRACLFVICLTETISVLADGAALLYKGAAVLAWPHIVQKQRGNMNYGSNSI